MRLWRLAAKYLRPGTKLTPDAWAAAHRSYGRTAGKPGPRDPRFTPYMIPFARAVASGAYRRVIAVTAAQVGKTDTVLDLIGARLDQRPAPIIYVGPTRDFLVDQFEPRLMALFDQADTLADKVVRGRLMKKTLKYVAGTRVRLAHAGSATALKSDPAALALIDEYDGMLTDVQRQGNALALAEARGETYADFVAAVTSTPSRGTVDTEADAVTGLEFWKPGEAEEIESPIWQLWQEGTRYHWTWPCPRCGKFFIPRLKLLTWPTHGTAAEAGAGAFLECPHCRGRITDNEKEWMNARGIYVAPGQTISEDGQALGELPPRATCSFWVSGLASPFSTWGKRVEDLLDAQASGDPGRIQTVINAQFGELYAPGGGDVPEWREVMALRLPYQERTLPVGVVFLVASIDVQKNRLVFVIRGWGARATSWLIDAGEIWGDTSTLEVWSELDDLLSSPIGEKRIKVAYIDSGFRPGKKDVVPEHRVYEFCRTHQRFVFPCKGTDTMATPFIRRRIEVNPTGGASKYGLELIRLSTDHWKLWVHERIRWPVDAVGAWHLHQEATEDYCRQIVSEARTKTPAGRPQWVTRARENHYFDCECMNAAAAFMLGAHRIGSRYAGDGNGAADTAAATKRLSTATQAAAAPQANPPGGGRPVKDTKGTTATFRDFASRMNARHS